MRFTEITSPEDQLALWRLISNKVWDSFAQTQPQDSAPLQANASLKAASSGLNETDQTSVRQILRYVGPAKEMDEDPILMANKILDKPKFAHLRAVFEGQSAGTVRLDYTGFEIVDGVSVPKLSAPKERDRS